MVRVICEFEAVVAKVAGTIWPPWIAPAPVEAPREFETMDANPDSLARASTEEVEAVMSAVTLATPMGRPSRETP